MTAPEPVRVPAGALKAGDVAELPLRDHDEIAKITRVVHPGGTASGTVLVSYLTVAAETGTLHLAADDLILRLRENLARAA